MDVYMPLLPFSSALPPLRTIPTSARVQQDIKRSITGGVDLATYSAELGRSFRMYEQR